LDDRGLQGIKIGQMMGKEIDTCTLALANAGALTIHEWDEIIISTSDGSIKHFAGYVITIEDSQYGPELDLVLGCQDYTAILAKARINQEWVNQSDATILANVRTNALPPLTDFDFSTFVQAMGIVPRIRSPRMPVADFLNELAARMGAEWWIDYDKKLHWDSGMAIAAPFGISDAPDFATTFPCADLRRMQDGTEIINLVTVVGGSYRSDDVYHEYAGDAQQKRHVIPHFYHAAAGQSAVKVDVNTGSDVSPIWTAKTVGIKYIDDTAGMDVLFAFREKFFEFATAPPALKKSWRVFGKYEAPLRVQVSNDESFALYGVWLSDVIDDSTLQEKIEARRRGIAYLAEKSAVVVFTGSTDQPGLRAGMVLHITNAARNVDTDYLIRTLNISFAGGGFAHYSFEIGDYLPDLYAMMRETNRLAMGVVEWREDEVLDILTITKETLAITETNTHATSTIPYYFSDTPSEAMSFGAAGAFDDT
jgi:hypothetical protein